MVRYSGSEHGEDQLFALIGEVIVRWNACESKMQLLLYSICGGGDPTHVLVYSLGNVALTDALAAVSDTLEDELREHVLHARKLFSILREHRNYLVHTPVAIGLSDETPSLMLEEITPKGGSHRIHQAVLKSERFLVMLVHLDDLARYLGQLVSIIYGVPKAPPISSLEKPVPPGRLEKSRHNLIKRHDLPESFEG